MITSFSNPLVKRIRRLRQKKYRLQEHVFYTEGLRVVLSAVEAGAPLETLVYCTELLTSAVAWKMIDEQQQAGVPCQELARPVFEAISERDHPVGLGAIISTAWTTLADLPIRPDGIYVALVEIAEPGNLGTVVRTMDAVGAAGLILAGSTVDPFHPTAVKASMGSIFSLPLCRADDVEALLGWAVKNNLQTLATSAKARLSFWQAEPRFPLLLLLGSEGQGLPPAVLETTDLALTIPMTGRATSLNLAVAAGILLFELYRKQASR